jgi:YHS domain-containing protein
VRGMLLLVLLVLVIALLWSLRGVAWRPRTRGAPLSHDRLVKDPVCRTYVVSARAVQREVAGALHYFCSRECADRYARGEGRSGPGALPDDRRGEGRA